MWYILIILFIMMNACIIKDSYFLEEKGKSLLNLEVIRASLVADNRLIEIRYRIKGVAEKPLNPHETYIIDESTGELIHISTPPRIPSLTPDRPSRVNFIVFPNHGKRLKDGSLITVVIGGLRQENIRVVSLSDF